MNKKKSLANNWACDFLFIIELQISNKKRIQIALNSFLLGAGSGNRTHVSSLEGWGSTIELHLHLLATFINYKL